MAEESKALGNAAFDAGDFTTAITHYTTAINHTPTNHLLYSNRSYAYYSLHHYSKALTDAQKSIQLKPNYSKAYGRFGAALIGLGCFSKAVSAYKDGLKTDPNNQILKSGLTKATSLSNVATHFDLFRGPELWEKMSNDPRTNGLLQDPEFLKMMHEVQIKADNLRKYATHPKMKKVIKLIQEIYLPGPPGVPDEQEPELFFFTVPI